MTNLTDIGVIFDYGSFEEMAEANGDTYPQPFIDEWKENYYALVTNNLKNAYPGVPILVEESDEQIGRTQIYVLAMDENGFARAVTDEYIDGIEGVIAQVTKAGDFWTTPSVEAIALAIIDGVFTNRLFVLEYEDAKVVFTNHKLAGSISNDSTMYVWCDFDQVFNHPLWETGSITEAATAFHKRVSE